MQTGRLFPYAADRFSTAVATLCCAAFLQACGGGGGSGGSPDNGGQPPVVAKGSVSLLAGSIGGAGNLDGAGAAARFDGPSGLALDATGNLYVADTRGRTIRKVTPEGRVSTLAGSGRQGVVDGVASAASFCALIDVATDSRGNVFVVDVFSSLRRIAPDGSGSVTTVLGTATENCGSVLQSAPLRSPRAVVADAAGNLYIADSVPDAIYKLTPAGSLTLFAGGDGPASGSSEKLGYVQGLAIDAAGNVYVADGGYDTIRKITPDGRITMLVPKSATLGRPTALALDAAGNLYVADDSDHVIRKLTRDGAITILAGAIGQRGTSDGPGTVARFNAPRSIAVDAAGGNIYVGDGSDTIRRINVAGNVTTLAGLAAAPDLLFGLYQATDRAGNVYAAQQVAPFPDSDFAIRRIAPEGTRTTLVAGGLDAPQGIAVDASNGNVYVADLPRSAKPCLQCAQFAVVYRITPQGVMTPLAGSTPPPSSTAVVDSTGSAAVLINPTDLAIDGSGNLYLAEFAGPLRRITPDGVVTTVASKLAPPSAAAGAALSPQGVAVDKAGNAYLTACPYYGRSRYGPAGAAVIKVDPRGEATVLAGSLTEVGFVDGAGAQARFDGGIGDFCANGIALDAAGNLFVADTGNDAVRRIAPDGTVSTVAGQRGARGIALGSLPASLSAPTDVSVYAAGNLYVGSAHAILKVRFDD